MSFVFLQRLRQASLLQLTFSCSIWILSALVFLLCLHRLFWNQTRMTLGERPVISTSCSFIKASGRGFALKNVLRVCSCFSLRTVLTRVLPSLEPGGLPRTLTFLCDPDSLSVSVKETAEKSLRLSSFIKLIIKSERGRKTRHLLEAQTVLIRKMFLFSSPK